MSALPFDAPTGPTVLLTTASSDGLINVYDLGSIPAAASEEQEPVASYDTKGSRLTCVSIAEGGAPLRKSKKAAASGKEAKEGPSGARFDVSDEEESEDDEGDEDMYDVASDEEGSDEVDGVDVEFEDEEEEEDEEEGEYED